MFDYAVNASRHRSTTPRWTTTIVSGIAHGAVLMTLGISALYATDTMPEPRAMLAFVTTAAPPSPPPPPPPAPAATRPHAAKKVVARTARPQPLAPVARTAAPAPVTAPDGISRETGLEGGAFAGSVDAGFETGISGGVAGGILGGIDRVPPPPPPPAPAAAPVRIGGEITAPRLVHRVDPDYPPIAQRAQIEGVVILEATVNPRGQVEAVRVLRSHGLLEHAAVAAVQQWAYEPLRLNGEPVPFVLTVTVSFNLADAVR